MTDTSIETIAKVVANNAGITLDEIRGHRRFRRFARPRQEAMYLMCEEGYSKSEIGRYLNYHHYTSVIHEIRAHERRMNEGKAQ